MIFIGRWTADWFLGKPSCVPRPTITKRKKEDCILLFWKKSSKIIKNLISDDRAR